VVVSVANGSSKDGSDNDDEVQYSVPPNVLFCDTYIHLIHISWMYFS